jgi:hypothetical protein
LDESILAKLLQQLGPKKLEILWKWNKEEKTNQHQYDPQSVVVFDKETIEVEEDKQVTETTIVLNTLYKFVEEIAELCIRCRA